MRQFLFQFRREQRADRWIMAENEAFATSIARAWADALDLDSKDDESDDHGELECIERENIPDGIQRVLDLSTKHTPKDPAWGSLRVAAHEHGWVVFLGSEPMEGEPAWAKELLEYARSYDCMLINFDSAGETLDILPTWDW